MELKKKWDEQVESSLFATGRSAGRDAHGGHLALWEQGWGAETGAVQLSQWCPARVASFPKQLREAAAFSLGLSSWAGPSCGTLLPQGAWRGSGAAEQTPTSKASEKQKNRGCHQKDARPSPALSHSDTTNYTERVMNVHLTCRLSF